MKRRAKRSALRHRFGRASTSRQSGSLIPLERVRRALLTPSNVGSTAYKALIFRAAKQMGYVERTPRYPNLYAAERFFGAPDRRHDRVGIAGA